MIEGPTYGKHFFIFIFVGLLSFSLTFAFIL